MGIKINNATFAHMAYSYKDSHIPYSKLDCQAFVERVLLDCGIWHDWRGSNHMWRAALDWKGTVAECVAQYGAVPPGAWLFTVKHDGGEKQRGYNDSEGNAVHVGIFCGEDLGCMHSSAGGVQCTPWPDAKRWTHVGLCKYIAYPPRAKSETEKLVDQCIEILKQLKGRLNE